MTVKHRNTSSAKAERETRLSTRAAREARNGLAVTLANLDASEQGLTEHEAAKRLARDGANQVAHDPQPHALVQLLKALNNPFIYVLLTLAGISFVTDYWLPVSAGEADDADLTKVIIIMTMVSLSSLLRFWQEYRSGKAADALKAMVRTTATVLRRERHDQPARLREVPMNELVAGDIVQLAAGDMIPADIRLIESRDLFISQAVLTGEALPVENERQILTLSVKADGGFYWNLGSELDIDNQTDSAVDLAELQAKVGAIIAERGDTQVYVRADEAADYGRVVAGIAELQRGGVVNLGLITEAPAGVGQP